VSIAVKKTQQKKGFMFFLSVWQNQLILQTTWKEIGSQIF